MKAYYTNTNITISEDNMEYIIDVELMKYKKNIEEIKRISDYVIFDNLEHDIINNIKSRLGKPYLTISYSDNDKETEGLSNFFGWC